MFKEKSWLSWNIESDRWTPASHVTWSFAINPYYRVFHNNYSYYSYNIYSISTIKINIYSFITTFACRTLLFLLCNVLIVLTVKSSKVFLTLKNPGTHLHRNTWAVAYSHCYFKTCSLHIVHIFCVVFWCVFWWDIAILHGVQNKCILQKFLRELKLLKLLGFGRFARKCQICPEPRCDKKAAQQVP